LGTRDPRVSTVVILVVLLLTSHALPAADFEAARAAFEEGDYIRAVELFEACREAQTEDSVIFNWLGCAQLKAGRTDDAIVSLREAVRLAPRDPAARSNLGNALAANDDVEGAMASYRAALEADPGFEDAMFNLALTLTEVGRVDEAVTVYGPRLGQPAGSAQAHLELGTILESAGKLRPATIHYQAARTADPSLEDATASLARALAGMGEEAMAADILRQQVAQGRATPRLRELLGILYQSMGQYPEAVAALTTLRDEGQNTFELHRALGLAQARLGDFADAAESLTSALAHRPRDVGVENNLGWAYAQQLHDEQAEEHLIAALEGDPDLVAARKTLVVIYRRQGRTGEVTAQLEAILATDPTDDQALHDVVRAYLASPDSRLSESTLERLGGIESDDHAFLGAAACLLIRQERYNDAVRALQKALRLSRADAALHNNLGVAYEGLGLLKEALKEYRSAHHLDPEHPEADANRQRVEEALARGGGL